MAAVEATGKDFEKIITENDIVVVDYWAPWCGPCRSFAPIFEEVSEQHDDIVFAKINTEEEQALAASFQIRSIPTLMVFREQVILYSEAGSMGATQLNELIEKVKEVDMAQVHEDVKNQDNQQA